MYDPQGDYYPEIRESTPFGQSRNQRLPCTGAVYCMRCGESLSDYTWEALEGAAFCVKCIRAHEAHCLYVLSLLPGFEWFGLLVDHGDVLWLTPIKLDDQGKSIEQIRNEWAFAQQYPT